MRTTVERRQAAEDRAMDAFGPGYDQLVFPSASAALTYEAKRRDLLTQLAERAAPTCSGTKVATALSPGCAICATGGWSCLFINGCCNASCFYCPTAQREVGEPVTNRIPFPRTQEYLEYLSRFGFRGASISGGEPLMTLERSLLFLRAIKQRFGAEIHCWLYTNGMLLDAAVAGQLRDAGLDELRFDIGASNYRLDKVALAADVIDCVTVEIPAIPEDFERIATKLPEMAAMGVRFLNLHQLRLTPHNFSKLVARGYTFAHGEAITVLESELTALRVILRGIEEDLPLGINYCSALYKSRFQQAAARQRGASATRRPHEEVTASGFLRQLRVTGTSGEIARLSTQLTAANATPGTWLVQGDQLIFVAALWALVEPDKRLFSISYTTPSIVPALRYTYPFVEVPLGRRRKIAVERMPSAAPFELSPAQTGAFYRQYLATTASDAPRPVSDGDEVLPELLDGHEQIERGLQTYY